MLVDQPLASHGGVLIFWMFILMYPRMCECVGGWGMVRACVRAYVRACLWTLACPRFRAVVLRVHFANETEVGENLRGARTRAVCLPCHIIEDAEVTGRVPTSERLILWGSAGEWRGAGRSCPKRTTWLVD